MEQFFDPVAVGKAVRLMREAKKISIHVAADLACINKQHFTAIEGGRIKPRMDTFAGIAYALGVLPSDLLKTIEENEK